MIQGPFAQPEFFAQWVQMPQVKPCNQCHVVVAQQVGSAARLRRQAGSRKMDDAIAAKPECIDLVMSNVQVIDSAGLNWILTVQTRLEQTGTKLRNRQPSPIK